MLTLTLTLDSLIPLEAPVVAPDRLAPLAPAELAALPVQHGNRTLRFDDVFTIAGDARDLHVEVHGACGRVKWLGHEMQRGRLVIHGDAGLHTGSAMGGGELIVHGAAGDWLGAEMRNGTIRVHGSAGNNVGAAYRGGEKGMRGGCILIDGDAGHEVGALMRRGLIAVGGTCGAFTGLSMIAGTIVAVRGFGERTGAGLKRGTLLTFADHVSLPPTFKEEAELEPVFLAMYLTYLRQAGFAVPTLQDRPCYRRFRGDRLALGKGEVLLPA